jgi:hypothetical protein
MKNNFFLRLSLACVFPLLFTSCAELLQDIKQVEKVDKQVESVIVHDLID